jgi:CRISPR-associated protein Cmr4
MPNFKNPTPASPEEEKALLYLYVETPLRAGAEPDEESAADLPIQREKTTQHPVIWASSLKGALRARAETTRPAEQVAGVFGPSPESADAEKFAAPLAPSDARLLLFPVRALAEIFAWVTCPAVIARFRRDVEACRGAPPSFPSLPDLPHDRIWVAPGTRLRSRQGRVTLEEASFEATEQAEVAALAGWLADHVLPTGADMAYWRQKLTRDLVVLPDRVFSFFALNATEVISRIRIDRQTGTAAPGALWTEEYLPVESLLYAPVSASTPPHPVGDLTSAGAVLRWLCDLAPERLQVGAAKTLGRGWLRLRWDQGETGQ